MKKKIFGRTHTVTLIGMENDYTIVNHYDKNWTRARLEIIIHAKKNGDKVIFHKNGDLTVKVNSIFDAYHKMYARREFA